jgi:hypothetical protein
MDAGDDLQEARVVERPFFDGVEKFLLVRAIHTPRMG